MSPINTLYFQKQNDPHQRTADHNSNEESAINYVWHWSALVVESYGGCRL